MLEVKALETVLKLAVNAAKDDPKFRRVKVALDLKLDSCLESLFAYVLVAHIMSHARIRKQGQE